MRNTLAALLIVALVASAALAQEALLPTGKEGLKKRSWVLLDSVITVRGERTVEVPPHLFEGKSLSYVAFYVDDKLIAIDEIPPFKITHDFGDYTHKAEVVAMGVKYEIQKPEPEQVTADTSADDMQEGDMPSTEVQGSETAATEQQPAATDADRPYTGRLTLLSPTAESYATGVLTLKAEVDLPAEQIVRVDFIVDGRTIGGVQAPPYEFEYDFGRSFNASNVEARAILKNGEEVVDSVVTQPLEGSDYYVRTRLVTLEATVLDWRDRLVGDLKQDEFRVYENGQEQEVTHFAVEERPIRVALLIDASSSMQQQGRMQMAIASAQRFLDFLKPEQDKVALIVFTDLVNKMTGWTSDFGEVKKILARIEAEGGTAINDTLAAVAPMFEEEPGRKAVVLLTDGYDEHSNVNVNEAVEEVRRAGVKIYSIGLFDQSYYSQRMQEGIGERRPKATSQGPDVDPTDARRRRNPFEKGRDTRTTVFEGLADVTGGAAFFPKRLQELPQVFQRIANELRNTYSIGYIPTDTEADGKWRDVKVETTRGGTHVRARKGYYAEK